MLVCGALEEKKNESALLLYYKNTSFSMAYQILNIVSLFHI